MAWTDVWLAGWRPYLLLGALCLCLYLPGIASIPVLDRDEARFAQATRQMLETGDFLRIRFQDEARNNKPAGIYWLQAVAVSAFSTPKSVTIWPYRLPSLLGASLAVLLIFGFGQALLGGFLDAGTAARTALIAAVLLGAALGTVAEAHIAKTDAALLAAITAGQGALGLCYVRARGGGRIGPGFATVFWLAEIAAIFLKGPVGPGLAIGTALTLSIVDRDASWLRGLRPIIGLIVAALVVAPWLYAIEHATEGQFIAGSLGKDFLSKLLGAQEAHGAPPFYYLVLAFLTFWPGSLFIVPAVGGGWAHRAQPVYRFLLAWLMPAWLVLELVPTKLPHYALPLYPALALLAASALTEGSDSRRWARWTEAAGAALWALVTLSIVGALMMAPIRYGSGIMMAALNGAAAVAVLAAMLYLRPNFLGCIVVLAALSLALVVPAASWVVPNLDRLWLSRAAAGLVAHHEPPTGTRLTVIGYTEPSLVFLLRDQLQFATTSAASTLRASDKVLVNNRDSAAFEQGLSAQGLGAQPIDSVAGIDYSNGQSTVLTLYQVKAK